jgi:hypothetical protein
VPVVSPQTTVRDESEYSSQSRNAPPPSAIRRTPRSGLLPASRPIAGATPWVHATEKVVVWSRFPGAIGL